MSIDGARPAMQTHIKRYVKHNKQADQEDALTNNRIYDLIDEYRILLGMTWREFIWSSIANTIQDDNEPLAEAIRMNLRSKNPPGRPKGSSIKAKLAQMGVSAEDIKQL